jgi:hypothetical protein
MHRDRRRWNRGERLSPIAVVAARIYARPPAQRFGGRWLQPPPDARRPAGERDVRPGCGKPQN